MLISKSIIDFLILLGTMFFASVTVAFAYATYQYSLNIQSLQLKFDKKVQKNIDANTDEIKNVKDALKDLIKELKANKQIKNEIVIEDAGDERTGWNL